MEHLRYIERLIARLKLQFGTIFVLMLVQNGV